MNNKYINNKDNNLSGSFTSKNLKDIKKKSGILMALLPLAACGGGSSGGGGAVTVAPPAPPAPPTPDYVESPTNVFVASSNSNPTLDKASSTADITVTGNNTNDTITTGSGDDTIDAKNGTNIIKSGSGTDTITTGSGADKIRAGEGVDDINGGSGNDAIVLVGTTTANQYDNADITNAGNGFDLSDLITLADLNGRTVSEVVSGEVIDGGSGVNTLFIYGAVDLTGVTLSNVTILEVHSDVTLTPQQLAQFTTVNGDGNSVINIVVPSGSSDTYILDLSTTNISDINVINIEGDITIRIDDISQLYALGGYYPIVASDTSTITLDIVDNGSDLNFNLWEVGLFFDGLSEVILDDQVTLWMDNNYPSETYAFIANGLTNISGSGYIKYDGVTQNYLSEVTVEASISNEPTGYVRIEGKRTEKHLLSISSTLDDKDGMGEVSYQWIVNDQIIVGATSETFAPDESHVGSTISVTAEYTDGDGKVESVTSEATSVISEFTSLSWTQGGFYIDGRGDWVGKSVSGVGDFNGDGYDDIILGSHQADPNVIDSGSSYVIFGSSSNVISPLDIEALNGINGFRLDGEAASDYSGFSVSGAGDFNGDGYDDLIIGAYGADINGGASGSSYIVFGSGNAIAANLDLSSLDGNNGFRLDGIATDEHSGYVVSSAGDFNRDGYDDLIIGAPEYSGSTGGSSYVFYGTGDDLTATIDLSTLNGTNGFRLNGENASDHSGWSVSSAGDINGDGYDDLIIGAYRASPDGNHLAGASYVVFGTDVATPATIELSSLDGSNGFRLDGVLTLENSGYSVSGAGDFNADGYDDIIIGAWIADSNGDYSGSSYLFYGTSSALTATIDLSTFDGTNGFRLDGQTGDWSGSSVSGAGDINGDGYDDIIIGSYHGSNYVVFGTASNMGGVINLDTLDGTNGFRISSASLTYSVSSAGDINGDGYDDLILGNASSYEAVIFGGTQWGASAQAGTVGDDTVNGTGGAETLIGGDGNDTLSGLADDDILKGGAGIDSLDGGTGADDLYGGGNFDTFILASGDSVLVFGGAGDAGTISGYDTIHDFETGNGTFNSETIDTVGTASVVADTAGTDGVDSTLTIGGATIKSHAITDGVITFDDADVFAGVLDINTNSEIAAALDYLQNQDFGDAGATVAFDVGSDAFLFTQGDDAGTDNLDVLVRLEGAQVDSLITTNGTGDFDLYIV